MTDPPASPCRLFVYLARDAPLGVVLRRGPSDWARLTLWRTDDDAFTHGQWMKARVYERRCDLSPDGALFVAFVRRSSGPSADNRDTWLAASRPPWFTALALWFVGGTYHTGGYFPDRRTLWPGFGDSPPDQGRLPKWLDLQNTHPPYIDRTTDWSDRTVWLNRLLRDGWEPIADSSPEAWRRGSPSGDQTLIMTIWSFMEFNAYGGPYAIDYAVHGDATAETVDLGFASWADWDHRGRLILARDGQLLHWQGATTFEMLADFNDQTPDPQAAPEEAVSWPRPR